MLISMGICIVNLVLRVFVTLSIFFDSEVFDSWKLIILTMGAIGICAVSIFNTIFMPEITNELVKRVATFVRKLDEVIDEGPEEVMIHLDNKKPHPFIFLKKNIEDQLKSFNGLKVLDFFTMKRSLLISILAQFVTFCIVLLQFKVAEHASFGAFFHNQNATNIN